MTAVDYLRTVFEVTGQDRVVSATNAVAAAQAKMAAAQSSGTIQQQVSATNRYTQAVNAAQKAQMGLVKAQMLQFGIVVGGIWAATNAYVKYVSEVENARDLTGATAQDSAKMVLLMRATGMSNVQQLREIMRTAKDVFGGSGSTALTKLGIPVDTSQNGLQLIMEIRSRLNGMQDGLRKTQVMQELLGTRGVAAMLPLLRVTDAQAKSIEAAGNAFSGKAFRDVQEFRAETAMLGQSLQQDLIFPLAQQLIPVIIWMAQETGKLVTWLGRVNDKSGGLVAGVVVFGLFSLAILKAVTAGAALLEVLQGIAATDAFISVLQNPLLGAAKVAAGLAIAGGAAYALHRAINADANPTTGSNEATDRFGDHVDRMGRVVDRMTDAFDSLKGKGVPGGLNGNDLSDLVRGAVGR